MVIPSFQILSLLGRPHGAALRYGIAGVGFVVGMQLTGRVKLARELAGLFARDRFGLGVHRMRWYLRHGWAARFFDTTPLFDITTDMRTDALPVLAKWLARRPVNARTLLAQLYVIAQQAQSTDDAATQARLMDEYAQKATLTLGFLPEFAPDTPPQPSENTFMLEDATSALRAIGKVLTAAGTPWYVISGTFLGAVREGAFLAHDYDIDIGINAEDFDRADFQACIAAAEGDLVLVNHSDLLDLEQREGLWYAAAAPALYRVLHQSGIGIDVFIHHLSGDNRWHGSAKHRWSNREFSLAEYHISGLTVRGPSDADRYLTENYGDWRTPVKSFSCSTGTPNVSFNRNLSSVAEMLRIAITTRGTDAQVAQLILRNEGYVQGTQFVIPWRL